MDAALLKQLDEQVKQAAVQAANCDDACCERQAVHYRKLCEQYQLYIDRGYKRIAEVFELEFRKRERAKL